MVFISDITLMPHDASQSPSVACVDVALPQAVWRRLADFKVAGYDRSGRRVALLGCHQARSMLDIVRGWRSCALHFHASCGPICAIALVDTTRALSPICFYGVGPDTMSMIATSGPAAALAPTVLDLPVSHQRISFDYWGNRLDQPEGKSLVGMCLTKGTSIRTPTGEQNIEDLSPGDLVATWNGDPQPVRMVLKKVLTPIQGDRDRHLWPVTIKRGAIGFGLPHRDLIVSADQRMLYQHIRVPLMFGEDAVFVRAKSLVASFEKIEVQADPAEMCYYQLLFDRHEVVFAEGAPTESFMPNADSIAALQQEERDSLFQYFPALRFGSQSHDASFMTLRSWELNTCVA